MLKATFRKKWVYGNPNVVELQEGDWFRWLRFVNIVANDYLPGEAILTDWDKNDTLFGYLQLRVDETGEPAEDSVGRRVVSIKGVKEAMEKAEAEDWRIETHQDIFPIAMRVIKWIERMESRKKVKEDTIRQVLEK